MLKRDANAKNAEDTNATTNVHFSTPRVSPQSAWSKFASKSSLHRVESRLFSVFGSQKCSYMRNFLKSYFIQSSNRYVLFLQRFDEECRLFRRDSFSLSPGRSRPSSGQSACGLSRPPTNQSVPSVARRPGAEASIKGFLSHVEGRGIEVAKSWVFD